MSIEHKRSANCVVMVEAAIGIMQQDIKTIDIETPQRLKLLSNLLRTCAFRSRPGVRTWNIGYNLSWRFERPP